MKLPCENCICLAVCKAKYKGGGVGSLILDCSIVHTTWLKTPESIDDKFLRSLGDMFKVRYKYILERRKPYRTFYKNEK